MIRALTVAVLILAALAVSVVVAPPADGRLDGRGVVAVAVAVVAAVLSYSWRAARRRDAERRAVIARMLAARRITSRGGAR